MTNPLPTLLRPLLAGLIALALPAVAQVPNTLLHSIPPPPLSVQSGARLGSSAAVDGAFAVVGAPNDDLELQDSGVVKVFDSASGALLWVIRNPSPAASDFFGSSVAISGTWVVVGATLDDTGASNDLSSKMRTREVGLVELDGLFEVHR